MQDAERDDSIAAGSCPLSPNPKDAVAYDSRGHAYEWGKGDDGRAIAVFDRAILLDPKIPDAYNGPRMRNC